MSSLFFLQFKFILKGLIASGYLPSPETLSWASVPGRVMRKLTLLFLWSYAMVAFALLDFNKWFPVSLLFPIEKKCVHLLKKKYKKRKTIKQRYKSLRLTLISDFSTASGFGSYLHIKSFFFFNLLKRIF